MFTTLSRIIKNGVIGFWRNGLLSTATIAVMFLAVMVFQSLMVFNVLTKAALDSVQEKIDISIYFKDDTVEDDILKIKEEIGNLTEVKSVEYVSKDKAFEIFQNRHKEEQIISQALDELGENPLTASLNIKAYNPGDYSLINSYINTAAFKNLIYKVSYAQNSVVIERLNKIIETVKKFGAILTILLSSVAVLITFNTIRLAIYSCRDEIGIMRLVGASNYFIRGPYVVEGMIYGLIAAILGFFALLPLSYYSLPYIKIFIPNMDIFNYVISNAFNIFGYQAVFGIILGVISSTIAIRKYLKN
ncbi:ABC transporter permease [Candidatus Wolfebacteria bacterium]|nr:ABC transporter permease [Candidatus Wolfebacteria bacterium]